MKDFERVDGVVGIFGVAAAFATHFAAGGPLVAVEAKYPSAFAIVGRRGQGRTEQLEAAGAGVERATERRQAHHCVGPVERAEVFPVGLSRIAEDVSGVVARRLGGAGVKLALVYGQGHYEERFAGLSAIGPRLVYPSVVDAEVQVAVIRETGAGSGVAF